MATKALIIQVSGKVQGVFFRASTKAQADLRRINGLVRNEPNGDVYIEAEGEEVALEEFLAWCSRGPSSAKVENIASRESSPKGVRGFVVLR